MPDIELLHQAILDRLSRVIDPETGIDVVRMRLIENLIVREDGFVSYQFRPSSPFCPIAIPLSEEIQKAVESVDGVIGQDLRIVGFALADELADKLKESLDEWKKNFGVK